MLMAIFVAYSTSGVTSGENVKVLNTASIWHQKWKDRPKL